MSVYFIATNIYGTSTCHTLGYEPNQCLPFFLDSRETSIAFSRPWDMGHCSRGGGGWNPLFAILNLVWSLELCS